MTKLISKWVYYHYLKKQYKETNIIILFNWFYINSSSIQTAINRFGSWGKVLPECGIPLRE
jgi:hypothetical protein